MACQLWLICVVTTCRCAGTSSGSFLTYFALLVLQQKITPKLKSVQCETQHSVVTILLF
jgi:hypothetical protein